MTASDIIPQQFRLSFNFFPQDLSSGAVLKFYLEDKNKLNIVFEITEEQKLEGQNIKSTVDRLKHQGCDIALDDFGTGYSNLDQLQKLNFDYLKIDRSFVIDIESGSIKSDFIPYIVKMANKLNLKVIAESVESKETGTTVI